MRPRSKFLHPPAQLSGCIFGAIFRDTRGALLNDAQRLNHFPASPLFIATYVIDGELQLMSEVDGAKPSKPLPRCFTTEPQDRPTTSWSPRPVAAISVSFYPEAWAKLEGNGDIDLVFASLRNAFLKTRPNSRIDARWSDFCGAVTPAWQRTREVGGLADWSGSTRLSDWYLSILTRVAMAGPGRSVRSFERRLKRWSRHSQQTLKFFSDLENLHMLSVTRPNSKPAGLACDAGYSDQSHMGRAVRRATGFSPAQLNQRIETEEAFWCYKLLGERF